DEAILSLTAAQFADPIGAFYPRRGADTEDSYARSYVKLARPSRDQLAADEEKSTAAGGAAMADPNGNRAEPPPPPAPPGAAPARARTMALAGALKMPEAPAAQAQAGQAAAIAIRSDFNPLAAWGPAVRTDAAGKATVAIKLPDNLTRYRVVAIAVAGEKQFGKGESAVTARLPLMVRQSPPRFLNFGDTFELPVVVQNQTDAPMTVRVAVRTTNAALTDGAGRE